MSEKAILAVAAALQGIADAAIDIAGSFQEVAANLGGKFDYDKLGDVVSLAVVRGLQSATLNGGGPFPGENKENPDKPAKPNPLEPETQDSGRRKRRTKEEIAAEKARVAGGAVTITAVSGTVAADPDATVKMSPLRITPIDPNANPTEATPEREAAIKRLRTFHETYGADDTVDMLAKFGVVKSSEITNDRLDEFNAHLDSVIAAKTKPAPAAGVAGIFDE